MAALRREEFYLEGDWLASRTVTRRSVHERWPDLDRPHQLVATFEASGTSLVMHQGPAATLPRIYEAFARFMASGAKQPRRVG